MSSQIQSLLLPKIKNKNNNDKENGIHQVLVAHRSTFIDAYTNSWEIEFNS